MRTNLLHGHSHEKSTDGGKSTENDVYFHPLTTQMSNVGEEKKDSKAEAPQEEPRTSLERGAEAL